MPACAGMTALGLDLNFPKLRGQVNQQKKEG